MKIIVAYGVRSGETAERAEERILDRWVKSSTARLLLWRREGATMAAGRIEQRTRLHQALFCIRAGFADTLWLPSWEVLGDSWSRALVCAEVWLAGGDVMINGSNIQRAAAEGDVEHEVATAMEWTRLRAHADPRRTVRESDAAADIGEYAGVWESGRLARKLRDDFELTDEKIATFLQETNYATSTGRPFSGSNVNALLRNHEADPPVNLQDLEAGSSSSPAGRVMVAFGADAHALVGAAEAFNAARLRPCAGVVAIETTTHDSASPELAGDRAERAGLVMLLTYLPLIGGVYVSSESGLGRTAEERAIVHAHARRHGVPIIVDGTITPADPAEDSTLTRAATSVVALHAVLRAHDAQVLHDDRLSLDAARQRASAMRAEDEERTYQRIAHTLNKEGFTTKKRIGRWSASAVRALLGAER